MRERASSLVSLTVMALFACACDKPAPPDATSQSASSATGSSASATPSAVPPPVAPHKLELHEQAMGTTVTLVVITNERVNDAAAERAMKDAVAEIRRLEALMTTYKPESELSQANAHAGEFWSISPDTVDVIDRGLWAGSISEGAFDITFHTLGDLWKFGSAAEPNPVPPTPAHAKERAKLVDYRLVELDRAGRRVKVPKGRAIDLGGIAKGYAVDRAAAVLSKAGLTSYLVQAGGDLYGAGRKLDGSSWVSGVQDPRGEKGSYFAVLPLEGHAFSTAGDYARYFIKDGRRYHHIIDPETGYPADASRSVTIWAPSALVADAVDDAVFILGPEKGLALVESLDGVGALIVDEHNKVWVSKRLEGKVKILREPTDGL
jgi:thiamine biosynthesis lipoprotein